METGNESVRHTAVRTDLCEELCGSAAPLPGIRKRTEEYRGTRTVTVEVQTEEGAAAVGKPIGTYLTLHVGKAWLLTDEERGDREEAIARALLPMMKRAVKGCEKRELSVLCVGLGNPCLASDAVGPFVLRKITVTRHLKDAVPALFQALGGLEVAGLTPGVVGQTGIETSELVRGAVQTVRPALLLAVDALAARAPERLAATVQISDTGIRPGSGIGNRRLPIDRETLGVPVVSVGVPTVIGTDTLIRDALAQAGIDPLPAALEEVLGTGEDFFVSLKECDEAVEAISDLVAGGIDRALSALSRNSSGEEFRE